MGGSGIRRAISSQQEGFTLNDRPGKGKHPPSKHILEGLLKWGLEQEKEAIEMLKALPPEVEEHQQLLERLDKLQDVIHQVKIQIMVRR